MEKVNLPKSAEELKRLRKELNMSQKELAKLVHVKPNTISQYENGKRNMTSDSYNEIMGLLKEKMEKEKTKDLNGIRLVGVRYAETSRGVSYSGDIVMDDVKVGTMEHRGDGGIHHFDFTDKTTREQFNRRIADYFDEIHLDVAGEESVDDMTASHLEYLRHETIAEHLMDIIDYGRVLTEKEKMDLLFDS